MEYVNEMAKQFNGSVIHSLLQTRHNIYNLSENFILHRQNLSIDNATEEELLLIGKFLGVSRPYKVENGETVKCSTDFYRLYIKNVMMCKYTHSVIDFKQMIEQFMPNGYFLIEFLDYPKGDIELTVDEQYSDYIPFFQQAVDLIFTSLPRVWLTPPWAFRQIVRNHKFYSHIASLINNNWKSWTDFKKPRVVLEELIFEPGRYIPFHLNSFTLLNGELELCTSQGLWRNFIYESDNDVLYFNEEFFAKWGLNQDYLDVRVKVYDSIRDKTYTILIGANNEQEHPTSGNYFLVDGESVETLFYEAPVVVLYDVVCDSSGVYVVCSDGLYKSTNGLDYTLIKTWDALYNETYCQLTQPCKLRIIDNKLYIVGLDVIVSSDGGTTFTRANEDDEYFVDLKEFNGILYSRDGMFIYKHSGTDLRSREPLCYFDPYQDYITDFIVYNDTTVYVSAYRHLYVWHAGMEEMEEVVLPNLPYLSSNPNVANFPCLSIVEKQLCVGTIGGILFLDLEHLLHIRYTISEISVANHKVTVTIE